MGERQVEVGLVSTIIPVHNRPTLLRDAVESVLAQTYRQIEILIVDDGSTDETPAVINKLVAGHRNIVRTVRIPNSGPGGAREAGRQLARGEFIQYLDSDDILMPMKFEWQVNGLRENNDCGVSYGKTRHYEIGTTPVDEPWKWTGRLIETMFPSFIESRWWGTATPLYRRDIIERAGPWLLLSSEEDWEYDCRIATQYVRLNYCDAFVCDQRNHPGFRLSRDRASRVKLRDRALAHSAIFGHARSAGLSQSCPEMEHFSRALFLLCRQCGAAGLAEEAEMLFRHSRAVDRHEGTSAQFRMYALGARLLGWNGMGRVSELLDELRNVGQ